MNRMNMSKDPAFLLYSQDFLVGTMTMTDIQVGRYVRLLCLQHQSGPLYESDMEDICSGKDPKIWRKFQQDENGLFYNERLKTEIEKRSKYSDGRRNNLAGKKKPSNNPHMDDHMNPHMENENEDVNKDRFTELEKAGKRIENFTDHVIEVGREKYSMDLLTEFISYWTEPTANGKKFRKELQPTWDTARRLATWKARGRDKGGRNDNEYLKT